MATELATRPPAFVDGKTQSANDLRLNVLSGSGGATPLQSRAGVRPSGGNPGLVAALVTPVMKVRVNAGIADVPSTSVTGGFYRVSWDQVDLDIDPSSAQARTDLIIVEVVDTGTAAATGKVRVLKGTSGSGRPSNPVVNAHWWSLASTAVRVNAESTGNIRPQDVTPELQYAVAPGGIVPVTAADVTAGVHVDQYRGHPTNGLERWDGTKWGTPTPLGLWTDVDGGTNYVQGLSATPAPLQMPGGGTSRSITVPNGHQLECEFVIPRVTLPSAGTVQVQLKDATSGAVLDGAEPSTSGTMWVPVKLRGTVTGDGSAHTIQIIAWQSGGSGAALQGSPTAGGSVRFRYRIN